MKIEKLKEEHILPYIPYGVKYGFLEVNYETLESEFKIRGEASTRGTIHNLNNWIEIESAKIVLRPLSDLINDDGDFYIYELDEGTEHFFRYVDDFDLLSVIPYDQMTILLKHHFDVFGLIDSGLAVDINTLKK